MRETGANGFKAWLIKELGARLQDCVIIHQDPNTTHQGIPDLLILHNTHWAMLEVKGAINSKQQPNQEYWVDFYNKMSYCSFVYPENVEAVLDEVQQALQPHRRARISQR